MPCKLSCGRPGQNSVKRPLRMESRRQRRIRTGSRRQRRRVVTIGGGSDKVGVPTDSAWWRQLGFRPKPLYSSANSMNTSAELPSMGIDHEHQLQLEVEDVSC